MLGEMVEGQKWASDHKAQQKTIAHLPGLKRSLQEESFLEARAYDRHCLNCVGRCASHT